MNEISRRRESRIDRRALYKQLEVEAVARNSPLVAQQREKSVVSRVRAEGLIEVGEVSLEGSNYLNALVEEKAAGASENQLLSNERILAHVNRGLEVNIQRLAEE